MKKLSMVACLVITAITSINLLATSTQPSNNYSSITPIWSLNRSSTNEMYKTPGISPDNKTVYCYHVVRKSEKLVFYLRAMESANLQVVWEKKLPDSPQKTSNVSKIVVDHNNGTIYLAAKVDSNPISPTSIITVYAWDPNSGEPKWSTQIPSNYGDNSFLKYLTLGPKGNVYFYREKTIWELGASNGTILHKAQYPFLDDSNKGCDGLLIGSDGTKYITAYVQNQYQSQTDSIYVFAPEQWEQQEYSFTPFTNTTFPNSAPPGLLPKFSRYPRKLFITRYASS